MAKLQDPTLTFLFNIYTEALKTHRDLDTGGTEGVAGKFASSNLNHIEIICHLDKSKYIGKHSHTFNNNIDTFINEGLETLNIPEVLWPEATSPELTIEERGILTKLKDQ